MQWKDYRSKILSCIDAYAFYSEELTKANLQYARHGNELKGQCPFSHLHTSGKDSNPSFTVNLTTGVYFCNACGSKGNIHTFYTLTRNTTKQEAWYALGDALDLERPGDTDSRPGIDPGLPVQYYQALKKGVGVGVNLQVLYDRGITDETIDKFCIGFDGERITIPIYDENMELVNIRRYKWNSYEDGSKMVNYTDALGNTYGENRLFGLEHIVDPTCAAILICEGEWDRLIAEQISIPAATATAGANNFKQEWFPLLKNKKRIYLCYDNDAAGRKATEAFIEGIGKDADVWSMEWPKDFQEKGDITDYVAKQKHTREEFRALFKPVNIGAGEVPTVDLATSSNAKYAGKRIKIPVLVAGKESAPYIYPKCAVVECHSIDDDDPDKRCKGCHLFYAQGHKLELQATAEQATLLKLINCPDTTQRTGILTALGCSTKCACAQIDIKQYGNLEAVQMIPKAELGFGFSAKQEYVARGGYTLTNGLQTNKRYTFIGYMHADPNSQRATYLFDQIIPEKDAAEDIVLTPEGIESLKVFQCKEGQTVADKFHDIHIDLERNVTYIWNRLKVAYAVDLVYHTALGFNFQEQPVKRGWAECLLIGDSGQAKTTLVERLMAHYRSGELLSGESARRTGLVYSLQQLGSSKAWTLMWGALPLNDGGLLTIDELSGMAEDDLALMSDVRSSGIAKANGVVTAETASRTRIIFISNPRNGRQLKAENYGVSAVLKLFGKAEDVRRLDFAVGIASGEVDTSVVNKAVADMQAVPHTYTSALCKLRVQWAWSRRPENIQFTKEAVAKILELAEEMGKKYASTIPLVEPADQRLKLARLAVSAAACVFSTDDGVNLIVKPEHAQFVYEYLCEQYDSKALGYDRYSSDTFEHTDTTDDSLSQLRDGLLALPIVTRTSAELVKILYQLPYFNRNTLEDSTGLDRDELKSLLQYLISNSIVEKRGQDYGRTQMGLALIESMLLTPPTLEEEREARRKAYSKESSPV